MKIDMLGLNGVNIFQQSCDW